MAQTIELDCAPFAPRPDSYLPGVVADTPIPVREAVTKLFGCWVFDYSDIDAETWKYWNDVIKARVTALYHSGSIRYGSW